MLLTALDFCSQGKNERKFIKLLKIIINSKEEVKSNGKQHSSGL